MSSSKYVMVEVPSDYHQNGNKQNECAPVNISELKLWRRDDYDRVTGFDPDVNFSKKALFFQSDLAVNGDLFLAPNPNYPYAPPDGWPPRYWIECQYGTTFGQYNLNYDFTEPNSGAPLPFPYTYHPPHPPYVQIPTSIYDSEYRYWGGDNVFTGKHFYTDTIATFGHKHILTNAMKILIKRSNPEDPTIAPDLMLESLIGGSANIFGLFSQVVDVNGNPVPPDSCEFVNTLKTLENTLIFATESPLLDTTTNPASINTTFLLTTLRSIAGTSANLNAIVDHLEKFLIFILRLKTCEPLTLWPWKTIFEHHQSGIYELYVLYKNFYCQKPKSNKYYKAEQEVNAKSREMMDGSNKLAGFFGTFFSIVAFLDTFITEMGNLVPQAINPSIPGNPILTIDYVHSMSYRYWYEHMAMFMDFCKVAAWPNPTFETELLLFKLQSSLMQSCGGLASRTIGFTFETFDNLVRNRGLYTYLSANCPPS